MSPKKTFFLVGPEVGHSGLCLGFSNWLYVNGFETVDAPIDARRPEEILELVPKLKEKLGQIDLLLVVATDQPTSTPQSLAYDFRQKFEDDLLPLLHAVVWLEPLFHADSKVVFLVDKPRQYSVTGQAIVDLFPAIARAINAEPGFEKLDVRMVQIGNNLHPAYESILGLFPEPSTC